MLVYGVAAAPKTVATVASADGATPARAIEFTFDAALGVLVLRKPDVKVAYDWSIELRF